jgi:peptide/nickel transport system ATP-binding protein
VKCLQDLQEDAAKGVALEIRGLRVVFHTYAGDVKALDGVDLIVNRGEILGLVGESGCGKSVTALSITGLLPENAEVTNGQILFVDKDLLKMSKNDMRIVRLNRIALVFQDPMTYLNPVFTIGSQLVEVLVSEPEVYKKQLIDSGLKYFEGVLSGPASDTRKLQMEITNLQELEKKKLSKREARRLAKLRALDYLNLVRLPEPKRVLEMYPFELSGGMRQRAMIAMALVRSPELLLADEITTALDVTVQAQILELLKELRNKIDASIILITHDLAVVSEICDRVAVMYAGNVIEVADVLELFRNPLHPYTKGLMAAVPRPDKQSTNLESIKGSVPDLIYPPDGCRFHPRCAFAFERCSKEKPPMLEAGHGHHVACWLFGG